MVDHPDVPADDDIGGRWTAPTAVAGRRRAHTDHAGRGRPGPRRAGPAGAGLDRRRPRRTASWRPRWPTGCWSSSSASRRRPRPGETDARPVHRRRRGARHRAVRVDRQPRRHGAGGHDRRPTPRTRTPSPRGSSEVATDATSTHASSGCWLSPAWRASASRSSRRSAHAAAPDRPHRRRSRSTSRSPRSTPATRPWPGRSSGTCSPSTGSGSGRGSGSTPAQARMPPCRRRASPSSRRRSGIRSRRTWTPGSRPTRRRPRPWTSSGRWRRAAGRRRVAGATAVAAVTVDGTRREVTIQPGEPVSVVLTPTQAATARLEPVSGSVLAVTSWDGALDPASLTPAKGQVAAADRHPGRGDRPDRHGDRHPAGHARAGRPRRVLAGHGPRAVRSRPDRRRRIVGGGRGRQPRLDRRVAGLRGRPARGVLRRPATRSSRSRPCGTWPGWSRPGRTCGSRPSSSRRWCRTRAS